VTGVLVLLAVSAGSAGSGLIVRHKRRVARGADFLARSEAWWNRRRHTWLAMGRAPTPVGQEGPVEGD
jgi:hypothetical protein